MKYDQKLKNAESYFHESNGESMRVHHTTGPVVGQLYRPIAKKWFGQRASHIFMVIEHEDVERGWRYPEEESVWIPNLEAGIIYIAFRVLQNEELWWSTCKSNMWCTTYERVSS